MARELPPEWFMLTSPDSPSLMLLGCARDRHSQWMDTHNHIVFDVQIKPFKDMCLLVIMCVFLLHRHRWTQSPCSCRLTRLSKLQLKGSFAPSLVTGEERLVGRLVRLMIDAGLFLGGWNVDWLSLSWISTPGSQALVQLSQGRDVSSASTPRFFS